MRTEKPWFKCLLVPGSILLCCLAAFPQDQKPESELRLRLKALPGVSDVQPVRFDEKAFKEVYVGLFEQPLDHRNPDGEKFRQRFFVAHVDFERPVLLETEGYGAGRPSGGELGRILAGSVVTVEHRFFGGSVPSPLRWEFLNIRQSADDLHAIVAAMKKIYPGKWVSSGASKGGQTALFYKSFYPDDVDACVPYVAPVNIAQEDPRIYRFLETVGDEDARARIKAYQIAMFEREDEILPLVKAQAEKFHWTFEMGLAEAYEYGVLEYLFAFWQFGSVKPADVPAPDAPAEAMFNHFAATNAVFYYSDQGRKAFEPFQYQAFTEIGYYNYDITDFKPHMKALKNPSNTILCPPGANIVYNPGPMAEVYRFLQYEGNRIFYIYGELDPWSATAVPLIGRTDAFKVVVKNGHHGSRIGDFAPAEKELFYSTLERWLDVKLVRQ
ncbi:MAG: S28 family serine protease [Candidatus Aminicenantales bacterium]